MGLRISIFFSLYIHVGIPTFTCSMHMHMRVGVKQSKQESGGKANECAVELIFR